MKNKLMKGFLKEFFDHETNKDFLMTYSDTKIWSDLSQKGETALYRV
jgi:hypothetical protein